MMSREPTGAPVLLNCFGLNKLATLTKRGSLETDIQRQSSVWEDMNTISCTILALCRAMLRVIAN